MTTMQTERRRPGSAEGGVPLNDRFARRLGLIRRSFRTLGPIVPTLAGRIALASWLTPPRFSPPAREREALASAERIEVPHGDRHVVAYAWGDGRPVFLLHGWAGRAAQLAAFVEPVLAAGFRAVALDAPAHGASPGRKTDLRDVALAIRNVAAAVGTPHGVIAHSFGGLTALVALRDGLDAKRVVTFGMPSHPSDILDRFAEFFEFPDPVVRDLGRRLEDRFGADFWNVYAAEVIARRLGGVGALIVHDRDDADVDWRQAERLAAAWPGAQLLLTDGLGHRRPLRDPDLVARAVAFATAGARPTPITDTTETNHDDEDEEMMMITEAFEKLAEQILLQNGVDLVGPVTIDPFDIEADLVHGRD